STYAIARVLRPALVIAHGSRAPPLPPPGGRNPFPGSGAVGSPGCPAGTATRHARRPQWRRDVANPQRRDAGHSGAGTPAAATPRAPHPFRLMVRTTSP